MSTAQLTEQQMQEIAGRYDGTTETINAIIAQYGIPRHTIFKIAKRFGYQSTRERISWTAEQDDYLKTHYGRVPIEDLCAQLGCTPAAIANRKKRLGISTRDFADLAVIDLERLTGVDHRAWARFIEDGWVKVWEQPRRNAVPVRRVRLKDLKKFFTEHPEVFDYLHTSVEVADKLELADLPEPPKYKLVTCRSNSFGDRVFERANTGPYGRADHGILVQQYSTDLASCDKTGGVDFWVPLYARDISCPRCGCKVSRFSEKACFSVDEPDNSGVLNAIAGKIGLGYEDGKVVNQDGEEVTEDELLKQIFSTKRSAGDALSAFRRLISCGLTVAAPNPVDTAKLLQNCLAYELRPGPQQDAWDDFINYGNIGVYWPPGQGKMFFLGMALTRLGGRHAVFTNTGTITEQWISHLTKYAPRVTVRKCWHPYHFEATVFNAAGDEVCVIEFYTYHTRADLRSTHYTVVGFDEAHHLPGDSAHRLSLLDCDYRVGLTATPYREDGRAELIETMTGHAIGRDWEEFARAGTMPRVPVKVVLVEDLEQKYEALPTLVGSGKTIVFIELLSDGERVASLLAAPFVEGATKRRLPIIMQNRVTVVSRVGDCGIDVPDLEEVIEFGFFRGSRAQSLQRLGRLLHARRPIRHTVMMTQDEFSRHYKRIKALEEKGFSVSVAEYVPAEPRVTAAVPLESSPWLAALGLVPPKTATLAAPARRYVDGKLVAEPA